MDLPRIERPRPNQSADKWHGLEHWPIVGEVVVIEAIPEGGIAQESVDNSIQI